jgi:hypothetical protein
MAITAEGDPAAWGVKRTTISILPPAGSVCGKLGLTMENSGLVTEACRMVTLAVPRLDTVSDS